MQDWDGFRFVLALARAGTLAGAARRLEVNATTVSRRVAALEHRLQATLFQRGGDNRYRLTAFGEQALPALERMEMAAQQVREESGKIAATAAGNVRITTVPVVANRVLVPNLPQLLAAHEGLTVEIVPEPQDRNLTQREADIAVRLSRPRLGGQEVTAQRIGVMDYGVYRPVAAADPQPWITYAEGMGHLPQARWLAQVAKGASAAGIGVSDIETALEAVANGLGQTLLPRMVAADDGRLAEVPGTTGVARDVWVLGLSAQTELPRIAAVKAWLASINWR